MLGRGLLVTQGSSQRFCGSLRVAARRCAVISRRRKGKLAHATGRIVSPKPCGASFS